MEFFRIYSISNKMILYFSLLFVVVILLIGTISYRMSSKALEEQMIWNTQKIMEQALINVDFYFSDIKTPMIMIARNPNVLNILQHYSSVEWQDRLAMKRLLEDFTVNINQFKSYIKDIILIGRNGFVYNINSADEISHRFPFFEADWMQPTLKGDAQGIRFITTHVSNYYVGSLSRDKVVSALLPIEENKTVLGYVQCDINLKKFNEIFQSLFLGSGGFIYMVDQQGKVIVHPENEMIGKDIGADLLNPISLQDSGYFTSEANGENKLIIHTRSKVTGWTLVGEIPYAAMTKAATQNRLITYLILAFSVLLIIMISFVVSRQITKPIKALMERIKRVQTHDFNTQQVDYGYGEVATIGRRFESMVFEINRLIQEIYVSNLKQKEAELKQLQNQINPHFLYNTLQLVKAEAVFGRNQEVSALVTTLGELLRYPMYGRNELVPLQEEVSYIRQYIDIYQRRFRGKFDFACTADDEVLNVRVPKLILQPIVENCIIHGFSDTKSGGLIDMKLTRSGDFVEIVIRDNGKGITRPELSRMNERLEYEVDGQSIGLLNVNQRIKLKYGGAYGIQVHSLPQLFTEVRIILPFATENLTISPTTG
jgi:two-component system sensor histidine kinase YesM